MSSSLAPPRIHLTPEEARFCDLLDDFAREGRKRIRKPQVEVEIPEVECRIAGGWVRDKLLGLPSSDLDITLSTCAGYPFALAFTAYLTTLPLDPPIPVRSIGKVNANPEQSKHLETATTNIMGLECDFVQLRSEVYADGSRIPSEIRIGTPEEDALRRDITINTLFYNVHTRQIEDHTHLGLSDLAHKLVRTPLDPLQTFRDDPLRVLRCVRFASRFGYELVDEVKTAVTNEEILEALRTRISRERVGIELEKMLKGTLPSSFAALRNTLTPPLHAPGPNPHLSISLTTSLSLYPHIFSVHSTTILAPSSTPNAPGVHPPPYCPAPHEFRESLLAADILRAFIDGPLSTRVHPSLLSRVIADPEPRAHSDGATSDVAFGGNPKNKHLWLACALVPCRGGVVKDKKKEVSLMEAVIREGLKLGNVDVNAVLRLFMAAGKLSKPQYEGFEDATIRSKIGNLLRDPSINDPSTETYWSVSLLFACVLDILPVYKQTGGFEDPAITDIINGYNAFVDRIEQLDLPRAIEEKPKLDGNEINALLKLKPSIMTKVLLQEVVTWQFDHPQATQEDCQQWLLQRQAEGRLPVVEEPVKAKKSQNHAKGGKDDEEKRKKVKKA
ncbi:hypothetical protein QFC20_003233 [Naganishia adeliensis]|uniref:Uncharacterized protein n=1 Tax=Naganishia adeliensis TaxID=92952 RepID=A0ACC2WH00_9TREE|nr:hypothetical protein QFC20_003233 [Naganishia adeliensis]